MPRDYYTEGQRTIPLSQAGVVGFAPPAIHWAPGPRQPLAALTARARTPRLRQAPRADANETWL